MVFQHVFAVNMALKWGVFFSPLSDKPTYHILSQTSQWITFYNQICWLNPMKKHFGQPICGSEEDVKFLVELQQSAIPNGQAVKVGKRCGFQPRA